MIWQAERHSKSDNTQLAKASEVYDTKVSLVISLRPDARRSIPVQDEALSKIRWRSEEILGSIRPHDTGIGVKC